MPSICTWLAQAYRAARPVLTAANNDQFHAVRPPVVEAGFEPGQSAGIPLTEYNLYKSFRAGKPLPPGDPADEYR
jgi:hypothetical protein